MSDDRGTLVVVEELLDHDSSSGARRAAGCATSSERGINVELEIVVVVVLVVVLLARRLPSCLSRSAKTPASFTEPATHTAGITASASTRAVAVKESCRDFVFSRESSGISYGAIRGLSRLALSFLFLVITVVFSATRFLSMPGDEPQLGGTPPPPSPPQELALSTIILYRLFTACRCNASRFGLHD